MDFTFQFANIGQRTFFYLRDRVQVFSGGFNNGKTFISCFKCLILLITFPGYRILICRQKFTDLRKTTMATFFGLCPKEFILSNNGQEGTTTFINGSMVYWMHLDDKDEGNFRGIEPNSIFIDQAEEISEQMFDIVEARLGRWSGAKVPEILMSQFTDWPKHKITGKPVCPSYLMMAVNPDTQFHFIYRKGHPDSVERKPYWGWVHGEWDANIGSLETYEEMLKRDSEWVAKYMKGEWGISVAQIHYVHPSSLLQPSDDLINGILAKGNLFRSADHGETAPTCCLWFAAYKGVYICYREYYRGGALISQHRQNITELSLGEEYSASYMDPSIFKKDPQKRATPGSTKVNFWSVADEYTTKEIDAPPIHWIPADNNEFATRNRINELLRPSEKFQHPVTGESPAPGLYFIKQSKADPVTGEGYDYPNGCKQAIVQLSSQRRKQLGTVDGKMYYDDERDDKVTDHAYDPIRYFIAMHGVQPRKAMKGPPKNSFAGYLAVLQRNMLRDNVSGQVQ